MPCRTVLEPSAAGWADRSRSAPAALGHSTGGAAPTDEMSHSTLACGGPEVLEEAGALVSPVYAQRSCGQGWVDISVLMQSRYAGTRATCLVATTSPAVICGGLGSKGAMFSRT